MKVVFYSAISSRLIPKMYSYSYSFSFLALSFCIITSFQLICGSTATPWNPKKFIEQIPCFTPTNIIPADWMRKTNVKEVTYFPFESKTSISTFSKGFKKGGIKEKDYDQYCLFSTKQLTSLQDPVINLTYSAFGKTLRTYTLKRIQNGGSKSLEQWKGNIKEETIYPIWKSSSKSNPTYLFLSCVRKPGIMIWFTISPQPTISTKVKGKVLKIITKLGFNPELGQEIVYHKCNL